MYWFIASLFFVKWGIYVRILTCSFLLLLLLLLFVNMYNETGICLCHTYRLRWIMSELFTFDSFLCHEMNYWNNRTWAHVIDVTTINNVELHTETRTIYHHQTVGFRLLWTENVLFLTQSVMVWVPFDCACMF